MRTDTQAIEEYINSGGAVGDAQWELQKGGKIASSAISAGSTIAGAGIATGAGTATGAVGTAVGTALTSASTALATAGVTVSIPVIGWVVAGVLVASAGGIAIASARRAKFLAKDRKILEKYISKYKKMSGSERLIEAKQQIAQIQFLLTRPKTTFNKKRQAKAEMKLEALYFLTRQERVPVLAQEKQTQIMIAHEANRKKQLLIYVPLILVSAVISGLFFKKPKKRKRK